MTVRFQRFELTNKFGFFALPIGYRKFKKLAHEFRKQCDANMNDTCAVKIKLMTEPPFHQSRIEPDHEEILAMENAANEKKVIGRFENISDITRDLFNQASYVQITAMTETRARGGRAYRAEFAGGTLSIDLKKKSAEVSVQALNGKIALSL